MFRTLRERADEGKGGESRVQVLTKNCVKLVVKRDSRRVMIPFKRSMKK